MSCEYCESVERLSENIRWLEEGLFDETDYYAISDIQKDIRGLEEEIDDLLEMCECERDDRAGVESKAAVPTVNTSGLALRKKEVEMEMRREAVLKSARSSGQTTAMLCDVVERLLESDRDCVVYSTTFDHAKTMFDRLVWVLTEAGMDFTAERRKLQVMFPNGRKVLLRVHWFLSKGDAGWEEGAQYQRQGISIFLDHWTSEVLRERWAIDVAPEHPNRKKLFLEGWEPRPPIDQPSTTEGEE